MRSIKENDNRSKDVRCRRAGKMFLLFWSLPIWASCVCQNVDGATGKAVAEKRLEFEVASIRPTAPGTKRRGSDWCTGDGFSANVPVRALILYAFGIREYQLLGEPGWVDSELYTVIAKVGEEDIARYQQGGDRLCRSLLKDLLMDRLKLVVKEEPKVLPVYYLVQVKGGSKLKAAQADPSNPWKGARIMGTDVSAPAMRMGMLTSFLSGSLDAPLEDHTGLSGFYAVELHWSNARDKGILSASGEGSPVGDDGSVSLFSALQDQLGLKLEVAKEPMRVVVVQQLQRPPEN